MALQNPLNFDYMALKEEYPKKFTSQKNIFKKIHRGDRIFVHTGCGEPQYLIKALAQYLEQHPKAFFDTELLLNYTMKELPYQKKLWDALLNTELALLLNIEVHHNPYVQIFYLPDECS